MRNTASPKDFEIHVDPSCLSDDPSQPENTMGDAIKGDPAIQEGEMSPESVPSNQTVVHHDSETKEDIKAKSPDDEEDTSTSGSAEDHKENVPAPLSPQKASVEEVADEGGAQEPQPERVGKDGKSPARERQLERIGEQIRAAAKAVVANIEHDHYNGLADSELSMQTEEVCEREDTEMTYDGTELSYGDGTQITYGDESEAIYETDNDHHVNHEEEIDPTYELDHQSEQGNGDSSDHHDEADVDNDDVFSHSDRSKRSSMNSEMHSSDDNQKLLTSPVVGEEAGSAKEMNAISSAPPYMLQTPADSTTRTPSKVLARPPFRTPSSVRAMQMSSPTQSAFSAPRSSKRHMPTVSRIGTPNSQYTPSKRTPTRFKAKREPLVLLHVTVLPLQWHYSYLMSSLEIPTALKTVKESWRLLQEKLGDTVLERGILLPHPQDSYEILEERLLEALELPVRPRAKILRCGHYMGPGDSEAPSSDEEGGDDNWGGEAGEQRKWCDICMRDVRLETVGDVGRGERRFRVKIYASNGLMRAGAWAACWKEMERVDVELEPFIETHQHAELEHLALVAKPKAEEQKELDDGFEDEDIVVDHIHDHEAEKRREEEDRMREEEARLHDEETRLHEEEQMRKQLALEEELRQRMVEEEDLMRKNMEEQRMEEQRMNEMYGQECPAPSESRRSSSRIAVHDDSSLPELLLAAFQVAMRDSKNVVICVLSVLILLLSLKPTSTPERTHSSAVMGSAPMVEQITKTVYHEAPVTVKPAATIEQVVQVDPKPVEKEPLTKTIFREFTVTEIITAATSVASESPSTSSEPCEPASKAAGQSVSSVRPELVEADPSAKVIGHPVPSAEPEPEAEAGDIMKGTSIPEGEVPILVAEAAPILLEEPAEKLLTPLDPSLPLDSNPDSAILTSEAEQDSITDSDPTE
ncbi:pathway-specific nitrogen regulator [Drepanopeziza brunnea f. sp. 'multigermtubi' MB_m1]|uniref:Pathway-specific nitrogen regulator n=1 Tax=Marssonina brunnea f. sp. multigermtubi (strain MB_m1) TaxID=1072389 RepID=K1X5S6_MARBU|nr:pathway-specific nitrogen regulator [Drepanopeziza brunnea f. sp. 'multigermtubi' MB_m1]EKD20482.1 pathway-specific nitrogen regulator [Drepanopeziza brunnea f. sp. 'multigermtubi' MB_m1]